MIHRHLNVTDDFPDIDAALAWAVQTLDTECLWLTAVDRAAWFRVADAILGSPE